MNANVIIVKLTNKQKNTQVIIHEVGNDFVTNSKVAEIGDPCAYNDVAKRMFQLPQTLIICKEYTQSTMTSLDQTDMAVLFSPVKSEVDQRQVPVQ